MALLDMAEAERVGVPVQSEDDDQGYLSRYQQANPYARCRSHRI